MGKRRSRSSVPHPTSSHGHASMHHACACLIKWEGVKWLRSSQNNELLQLCTYQFIVAEREPRWVFRVNIVSLGTEKEIGTVYVCMYVCMYVCILYCTVSQNDCSFRLYLFKDPHAIPAPNRYQRALSVPLQPNHTINTTNSNTYHLLEKVTKIHKRQVYNPKNE